MTRCSRSAARPVTIGEATILRDAVARALGRASSSRSSGPNGAGKSTLARAAAGIQKLAAGTVRWDGQELRGRQLARVRAFVPQRPRVPDGIVVREAVEIGRSPHIGPLRRATRADHDAVDRALERAGVQRARRRAS